MHVGVPHIEENKEIGVERERERERSVAAFERDN